MTPGTYFQGYYVIAPLAAGGMGQVLLGFEPHAARLVAIKVLAGARRFDGETRARLEREAEVVGRVRHASVVRLLDVGETPDGSLYLVQEHIRGQPLDRVLAGGPPPPIPVTMAVLEDLAGALHAAHRARVIHRDVKPQNVILGADRRATLVDFGLARSGSRVPLTEAGAILGTLSYAAPEQRRGDPVDARADIFSLGAVLYEMLTGRRALQARTVGELLEARTWDLAPPSRVRLEVPSMLDELCFDLLADDPEVRCPDLGKVLVRLGVMRIEATPGERRVLFGDPAQQALNEAISALRRGDADEALAGTQELAADPPPELAASIHHLRALVFEAREVPHLGLPEYERALAAAPDSLDVVLDCALALVRMGRAEEAEALLQGTSGPHRWDLLVLGLLDAIAALPEAPEPPRPEGLMQRLAAVLGTGG